jgi:hypothetical protein
MVETVREPRWRRDVAERVLRCVSTMVYYQSDGWSWSGAKLVTDEADDLLRWAAAMGLTDVLADSVLDPLKDELIERYGEELGLRLHEEFLRGVDRTSGPGPGA